MRELIRPGLIGAVVFFGTSIYYHSRYANLENPKEVASTEIKQIERKETSQMLSVSPTSEHKSTKNKPNPFRLGAPSKGGGEEGNKMTEKYLELAKSKLMEVTILETVNLTLFNSANTEVGEFEVKPGRVVGLMAVEGTKLQVSFGDLYSQIDAGKTDFSTRVSRMVKTIVKEEEMLAAQEEEKRRARLTEEFSKIIERGRISNVYFTVLQVFEDGILITNYGGVDSDREHFYQKSPAYVVGVNRIGLAPGNMMYSDVPFYLCGTYSYVSRNGSQMQVPKYAASKEVAIEIAKQYRP